MKLTIVKNNVKYSSGLVFRLEFIRLIGIIFISFFFMSIDVRMTYLINCLGLIFTLFSLRIIKFFNDCVVINYPFRIIKRIEVIHYETIKDICYSSAEGKAQDVIAFSVSCETYIKNIYAFLFYRFVPKNSSFAVELVKFVKGRLEFYGA